jgi:hypothetical protein
VTEQDPLLEIERLINASLELIKKAKNGHDGPQETRRAPRGESDE